MVRLRPWIRRTRRGRYVVALPGEVRALLGQTVAELRAALAETTEDPNLRRLFPTAYHEDPELDAGYQAVVREELKDHRVAALDAVAASLDATELDAAGLTAWMTAVNDVRLVLGTALDVGEEHVEVPLDHPDAGRHAAYGLLTHVLGEIVDALADGLGDQDPRR